MVHSQVPEPIQDGHSTGDRNRTCELLVQSQTQRPTVATPEYSFVCSARAEGVEPSYHCFKGSWLTVSRHPNIIIKQSAMSESNRPVRIGNPVPLPLGQWHNYLTQAEGARVELARLIRSLRFERSAVANRLALPLKAPEAGIEPATKRLTVALPYQHRTLRSIHKSGWADSNCDSMLLARAPEARALFTEILARLFTP